MLELNRLNQCKTCNKKLFDLQIKNNQIYCSHSCAATSTNILRRPECPGCKGCGIQTVWRIGRWNKFCEDCETMDDFDDED